MPSKSEKYVKTLIAYANTAGGKLIIGVEDTTKEIVGVNPDKQSQIIDRITNALADSVSPQIIPSITSAGVRGETVARKDITLANLENWNIIKRDGNKLLPTIAFDSFPFDHHLLLIN